MTGQTLDATALGDRLEQVRTAHDISQRRLARATGLSARQIAAFEAGRATPSGDEAAALADVLGIDPEELMPPGHRLAMVGPGREGEQRGTAALDALLREYVSMVLELRGSDELPVATLRHDDLTELARALGGTPDAIEARLVDLLGTDARGAHAARATIFPAAVDS